MVPLPFNVFLQDSNDGDPVLCPHRTPFLPDPSYDSGGLQVSASGPAKSLLLDQRDLRCTKRHHLCLNPHQLSGRNDQYCEFKSNLQVFILIQSQC